VSTNFVPRRVTHAMSSPTTTDVQAKPLSRNDRAHNRGEMAVRDLEATFVVELLKASDFGSMGHGLAKSSRAPGGEILQGMVHDVLGRIVAERVDLGLAPLLEETMGLAEVPRRALDRTMLSRDHHAAAARMGLARMAPNPKGESPDVLTELLVSGGRLTSHYGERKDPFSGEHRVHQGVDIAAKRGAPIKAAIAGTVTFAGSRSGYGNVVEITSTSGHVSRYAHLDAIAVSQGDVLPQGSAIGTVGSTGRSTGPHLHFEVRHDGNAVDPLSALRDHNRRADEE
jgi:murein DD-endopeptidase MepM/ murein hydrolase activator NlpD